jgi:hypothetical protein
LYINYVLKTREIIGIVEIVDKELGRTLFEEGS